VSTKATTQRLCLVVILLYAAAWRVATLDRPFDYDDEATGAAYGVLARNYLEFGLVATRALPALTVGAPPPNTPLAYYRDHPPLVPLLIALTYLSFGFGEWQTRLLSAIASVCAVWVLHRLVKRERSDTAALIAAAIYAATPMNLYFGGMPEVLGAALVLFSLLAVDAYLLLHDRGTARRLSWLIVTFTAAAICDWPAFILAPVLVIHFLATRPRDTWPWMYAFAAAALAVFAALYVYIASAARLPWNWMVPLFLHRSAIGRASFSAAQWWSTAATFNRHLHTLPVLMLSGLWLLTDASTRVGRILLAWGILHVAIGRQGVFNHEWWWWPLTPGLAVTAALFLDSLIAPTRLRQGYGGHVVSIALVIFATWTSVSTFR
jgi:4-amino-4-deoxy-L-arabinose transferase-like glycosyltransferase